MLSYKRNLDKGIDYWYFIKIYCEKMKKSIRNYPGIAPHSNNVLVITTISKQHGLSHKPNL